MRSAAALPSMTQTEPASEGRVRPLKVCKGCKDPVAEPRSAKGLRTSLASAPLVCKTIFPRQGLPRGFLCRFAPRLAGEEPYSPKRASAAAVSAMARSGVEMRITSASRTGSESSPCGVPLPMRRRASRALRCEREITGPMRHPFSRKRRPSALPTRPAPMIAIVGFATDATPRDAERAALLRRTPIMDSIPAQLEGLELTWGLPVSEWIAGSWIKLVTSSTNFSGYSRKRKWPALSKLMMRTRGLFFASAS